jgi:hypothetical protein
LIDESGARNLMAAILRQAHDDYIEAEICPAECPYTAGCEQRLSQKMVDANREYCDARDFIHSDWAGQMCEGLGVGQSAYIKICKAKRAGRLSISAN